MASAIIRALRYAALVVLAGAPLALGAQQAPSAEPAEAPKVDFITPHITDSHELELPCFKGYVLVACPHELWRWPPVHIGPVTLDLSPTKHVVWLGVAAFLCTVTLIWTAAWHRRHTIDPKAAPGFATGLEAMVLYLRQTVVLPNVGPHGDAYTPFILTLFYFILFANLVGLIPYGATPTGNIAVTAALALVAFVVIEISGMRALGKKYWSTIVYWNHDLGLLLRILMCAIMTPIEIVSKLTKPFALTIRLFANMTAGHVVLLVLISLIFTFHSWVILPIPLALGVAVSLLEIFVAVLQAFVFSLLTAVFIGQIRQAAH
jgi:F-type H+-transporting ATPase subunit a